MPTKRPKSLFTWTWASDLVGLSIAAMRGAFPSKKKSYEGSTSTKYSRKTYYVIMSQISELLSREEIMEKQRARLDWLKDGDINTAFYQVKARERARVNRITSLRTEDGGVVTQPEELETVAETFYTNVYMA